MQDKESRISDLRKKNQELEKFKFVLDSKIRELHKTLEPHEKEIIHLSEVIQAYHGELHDYQVDAAKLNMIIMDLKMRLSAETNQLYHEKKKVMQLEDRLGDVQSDVFSLKQLEGGQISFVKVKNKKGEGR